VGHLEVKIKLVAILKCIFIFLMSNVFIYHLNVKSSCSDKVSSTPEVLVIGIVGFLGILVVNLDSRLPFQLSHDTGNRSGWWNLELKMNMIFCKMSFDFFYLHLSKKFIEDNSKLIFKFSIYNLFAVLWTKDYVVGTIPLGMRRSCSGVHRNIKVMVWK